MSHAVFLTGATGNVGAPLLNRLLRRPDVAQVVTLVRAESEVSGLARVRTAVLSATGDPIPPQFDSRVRVVCGDVTASGLGLNSRDSDELARSITHIMHAAASTQFTLPLESARQVNCGGTRQVLELARAAVRHGHFRQMVHVSTAYVCGTRSGRIYEDDSAGSVGFTNAYEQSKWEAEEDIRREFADLPVTIVRPSIIVGDSESGRVISCNVLYTPLRWIVQRRLTKLYCSPDTPLDVVSTDFVARSIAYLLLDAGPAGRTTLHLTAGTAKSMTVGQIVDYAIRFADQRTTTLGGLETRSQRLFWMRERDRRCERPSPLDAYHPYMSIRRDLDTDRRESILSPAGIEPRHLKQYLPNILEYCLRTNWGKHAPMSAQSGTKCRLCMA